MEFNWQDLLTTLEADGGAALCTIIERHGSVPREVGARMLVRRDGSISGTVGGGIGEHEVIVAARAALENGFSRELGFSLAGEQGLDSAAICGGNFRIHIGIWQSAGDLQLIGQLVECLRQNQAILLAESRPAAGNNASARALYRADNGDHLGNNQSGREMPPQLLTGGGFVDDKRLIQDENHRLISRIALPPQMIIFGGGHLAQPLAEMAAWCRFAVTVIDDRPEFSGAERFPTADRVLTAAMEDVSGLYKPGPQVYLVLITREHKHDYILLQQLLGTEYAYMGMIGSRRRTSQVKQRLLDEGFDPEEINRLCSPIGLEIGAQTPAEIAVSIMAEIIQHKYKNQGVS